MWRWIFSFVPACLAGCSEQPVSAYRDVRDQVEAAVLLPIFGYGPCRRAATDNSYKPGKSFTELCYRLEPQKRWTGLWWNEFEGSRFCTAPATDCPVPEPGEDVWLDQQHAIGIPRRKAKLPALPEGLYAIDFIGRKTAVKGRYGHFGVSDHSLIVDRVISLKMIRPKSREPSADSPAE